jgi:hypothetical protein
MSLNHFSLTSVKKHLKNRSAEKHILLAKAIILYSEQLLLMCRRDNLRRRAYSYGRAFFTFNLVTEERLSLVEELSCTAQKIGLDKLVI